jgi:2,4-didehydro-3-deoxy-L-rhamnonate hydrolase
MLLPPLSANQPVFYNLRPTHFVELINNLNNYGEEMKLLRYGVPGQERPAILASDGSIRDLSSVVPDLAGQWLLPESMEKLRKINVSTLPKVAGQPRLGPCVGGVGKFVCIGLNYSDHAAESGMAVPREPVVFMKATSAIVGPDDDVVIPRGAEKADWEVELGVVIGKPAKYVEQSDALSHVAGYCVINDLSERAFQLEGTGQWVKGKSADTFGPIGPWLVTTDEVPDPQNLDMWLEVDGHRYQNGSTKTMVFGVAYLISYLSRFMSLRTGDVISTGTPPGVGLGQKPPVYLRPGNRIRLGVNGLGEQNQKVVAEAAG